MTDNEIIKALKCCINADCCNCPRCSEEWNSGTCNYFLSQVLDLIMQYDSSIEEYKDLLSRSTAVAWFWHEKYIELSKEVKRG